MVVNELSPAAKELVKQHEESGAEAPTMQQITQMVLCAKSVPPVEKRHTMMLLFRHWGYAGGEKPPASDHPQPTTSRERVSEEHERVEHSGDVESPAANPPEAPYAAVEAGSSEVDAETPLLPQEAVEAGSSEVDAEQPRLGSASTTPLLQGGSE